jgi:DNA-binding response OmpR family regulator
MRDGRLVILCVDDDPDILRMVRLRLEDAGYIIKTASSGEEGLKAYKAEAPDFIIVDLIMEEIDAGLTLVKELKLAGNKAPIYMLSGTGDQLNLATNYRDLGLDGVLQKPIDFAMLLRTLKAKVA